ncbi:MAG: hypothetical protein NTY99_00180 [DPANN group archaeon]|nr:hypothetical protein [DPANN group archaeon]
MALYEPGDVLQVARNKLCKEFKDKDLHPVGCGDGRIWINLYDDARLAMSYDNMRVHYELFCPFRADPLLSKIADTLLPGKCPTPPITNKLEVLVQPGFNCRLDEEQFKKVVNDVVDSGKQILDLYFKYYESKELESHISDTPQNANLTL